MTPWVQKPGNHPNFRKMLSDKKAILGALGEFRGILGAALGIRNFTLGIRNSILRMASHNLSNTKTKILEATPGVIPGIDGTHMKDFHLPQHSRSVFSRIGVGPRAPEFNQRVGSKHGRPQRGVQIGVCLFLFLAGHEDAG